MAILLLFLLLVARADGPAFRVAPYLQDPSSTAMSVLWVSESSHPGEIRCWQGDRLVFRAASEVQAAPALDYPQWEVDTFLQGRRPPSVCLHRVRVTGLQPGQTYRYAVQQDGERRADQFRTAPGPEAPVRFLAYADCETEPESTGYPTLWESDREPKRVYLVDQTDGYAANLRAMAERQPDFVVIAGDLVESGGEQRDWDEFWKHNASLAARIPLFAAVGNHEYYGGPKNGGYQNHEAVKKWDSYFRMGRFYRRDYGPVCLIAVDGCNGHPEGGEHDSNLHLECATDFNPGSDQYAWLENQLRDAQRTARFTFVTFHHCPYSSGPHGPPTGRGPGRDPQSGQPLRVLTPLCLRYGVTALLTGHDEMGERSEVEGEETRPDGSVHPHTLQVYDVGIGGDGLRAPEPGVDNPRRRFLVHRDVPEVWRDGVLVEGGKHYGHLEVNVHGEEAVLTPVYVFPVVRPGQGVRWERRVYPDVVRVGVAD